MLTALLLSLVAGFANLFGGFLAVSKRIKQNTLRYFTATAAGFILAVTILDLYPDVTAGIKFGPLLILIGFVAIFLLENFFAVHAHGGKCEHEHTLMGKQWENGLSKHSAWAAFIGLLVHTFFDGAAITARFMVSQIAGLMVFIAVLSHKVPEGFSMSAIFRAGHFNRLYSFLAAAALGASTVLGATVVYFTQESQFSMVFLALATGSFTYIVTAELVPYVSGTKDKRGIIFFLLGIILYYLTSLLLENFGLK